MKRDLCWMIVVLVAIAILFCGGCNEDQKIWGQGELPADWKGFFGTSNGARLDIVQTREINQTGQVVNQHHAIIHGLDIPDPNGPTVHKRGLIERVTALEGLIESLDALNARQHKKLGETDIRFHKRIEVLEVVDVNTLALPIVNVGISTDIDARVKMLLATQEVAGAQIGATLTWLKVLEERIATLEAIDPNETSIDAALMRGTLYRLDALEKKTKDLITWEPNKEIAGCYRPGCGVLHYK